jgi:hypothetical protein
MVIASDRTRGRVLERRNLFSHRRIVAEGPWRLFFGCSNGSESAESVTGQHFERASRREKACGDG